MGGGRPAAVGARPGPARGRRGQSPAPGPAWKPHGRRDRGEEGKSREASPGAPPEGRTTATEGGGRGGNGGLKPGGARPSSGPPQGSAETEAKGRENKQGEATVCGRRPQRREGAERRPRPAGGRLVRGR